ncbi:hypothetical protein ZIOFF_030100 [Zingiber officinale]|uniref:Uncharacterized protein n=1 Tax=Zingiber officinale TaxID=94328 RepID=A0A8J5LBD8_ZINOF|nr:hypothetical protein ZIOFF_030100 [Zingiber officinale]
MQSNLQLLKSCLQGNENWNIIKQIPWIKVLASSDNDCDFCGAVYICFLLHLDPLNWMSPFTIQSETPGERSKTWHTDFRKIAMMQFSARAPLIASLRKGLASEPVEGPPLPLEGVDHIHGSDRLAASVLSVGHGVADDILEEDLEYAAGLLVDQAADALDAATAGEAAYRRLGDALNVVAEDLAVALSAALAEPLASLAAAGHGDDLNRESRRLLQRKIGISDCGRREAAIALLRWIEIVRSRFVSDSHKEDYQGASFDRNSHDEKTIEAATMADLKNPSWVDPNTKRKDADFLEELWHPPPDPTMELGVVESHFVAVAVGEAYSPFFALEMTLCIANLRQRMVAEEGRAALGIRMREFQQVRSKTEEMREELESIETWRCDIEVAGGGERVKEMVEELKGSFGMLRSGSENLVGELDDLFDEIVEAKKTFMYLCSRR